MKKELNQILEESKQERRKENVKGFLKTLAISVGSIIAVGVGIAICEMAKRCPD